MLIRTNLPWVESEEGSVPDLALADDAFPNWVEQGARLGYDTVLIQRGKQRKQRFKGV